MHNTPDFHIIKKLIQKELVNEMYNKGLIDFIKEEVKEKYDIDLKVEQEFKNWE